MKLINYDKTWKVGDRVIVDLKSNGFKLGEIYTITVIAKGRCGCGNKEPYIGINKSHYDRNSCWHYGDGFVLRKVVDEEVKNWKKEMSK